MGSPTGDHDGIFNEASSGRSLVKVRFRLEKDADGYPPVSDEGVWAAPIEGDTFRLENTPWFVRGVAYNDIVRATRDAEGVLWVSERIKWSGRLTIRVTPRRSGPHAGDLRSVLDAFRSLGVDGEGAGPAYNIVALNVPPEADLAPVKALLRHGEAEGWWYIEEGCVSDAWLAL